MRFNYFVSTMRLHLKSIRSREEGFAELKNRKRALQNKIESVEKKLARMGPENRDLAKVTGSLKDMRSDMEVMRNELISEDAAIGDFKRRTMVEAIGLKAGGLMEMAEKSVVIAETMRLLIDEIPQTATAPGQPRVAYRNEARTDRLIQEAVQQLDSIRFAPRQDPMALGNEFASPVAPSYRDRAATMQNPAGLTSMDALRQPDISSDNIPGDAHGSQGWVAQLPHEMNTHSDALSTVQEERQNELPQATEMERVSRNEDNRRDEYGVDDVNDVIPGLPPVDPSYPAHTPLSENSTHNNYEDHNRAYFEGVGGTKALQAAAARTTAGFPTLDRLDLNSTPGMFASDTNGRNLPPAALMQSLSASSSSQPLGMQPRTTADVHGYPAHAPAQYDVDPQYIQAYDHGYPQAFPEMHGYDDYGAGQRFAYGDDDQTYARQAQQQYVQQAPEQYGPDTVAQEASYAYPHYAQAYPGTYEKQVYVSGQQAYADSAAPPYETAGPTQAVPATYVSTPSGESQPVRALDAEGLAQEAASPALAPPFTLSSLSAPERVVSEAPAPAPAPTSGLPPYLSYT